MKKIFIIFVIVLMILIIPIPLKLKDGGSTEYKAILYNITKVHRLDNKSSTGYEEGWKIEILGIEVYNEVDIKVEIVETINTVFETYYKMSDGTWQLNGNSYKYRLEITGRMPLAEKDSTYVYLSNIEDIPFEKAYLAAGLSSSTTDYFPIEDAILVDLK